MKILVGCEESQAVMKEFRKHGHEAFSCDIQECSGGRPEWHIQGDIFSVISDDWDMSICFPPCTHLAVSGAAWFEKKRKDGRQKDGIEFFVSLWKAANHIPKVCFENPIGILGGGDYLLTHFPEYAQRGWPCKPSQIIQPYYFGDEAQKTTCLWLRGLPPLMHRDKPDLFSQEVTHVGRGEFMTAPSGRTYSKMFWETGGGKGKERSKTFPGIAAAMADQWG